MIRINLLPSAKRSARKAKREPASKGSLVFAAGLMGWLLIGGAQWYALDVVQIETEELRQQTARNKKRAEEIRKLIDEEGLKARREKVEQMRQAIDMLERQRRTPVYVFHELANILTTGRLPDIDEEKQRKLEAFDPQARLDLTWDATSVWINKFVESGGNRIVLEGAVRDPTDLNEFVKRLRSSARFTDITHPSFEIEEYTNKAGKSSRTFTFYNYTIEATVTYWN